MSTLDNIEKIIDKYNKEVLSAKKKKMKSLPGWYGLNSPHAGGAGISEDKSEMSMQEGPCNFPKMNMGSVSGTSD